MYFKNKLLIPNFSPSLVANMKGLVEKGREDPGGERDISFSFCKKNSFILLLFNS